MIRRGLAPALGENTIVAYNDLPVAFGDFEGAECLEVLSAGNECTGAVLTDGTGEAIAGDDQVAALVELCYHVHGEDNRAFRLGLVYDIEICCGSLPID